jgi:DNA-binding transcriptional MocR family regulator
MTAFPQIIKSPFYRHLGDLLIEKIHAGEIAAGEKLPTIRALAAEMGVNNTTVVSAYKYLEQKNIVYSVQGSGTFVASPEKPQETAVFHENFINFSTPATEPRYFPKEEFRHAFDAVLARDGAVAFEAPDSRGYLPLREMFGSPENVQIIADINEGIRFTIDALLNRGDVVFVESPSAQSVSAMLTSRGVRVVDFPVNCTDFDKIKILAQKYKPKLFFLTPNYQLPTGLCYTNYAKEFFLELAHNFSAYIIEIDGYGDFFYHNRPTPLKAADNHDLVIYMKSFDRILAANMAGYMVLPEKISDKFRTVCSVSGFTQRGLDYFLRNNFDTFSAKIRSIYAKKYRKAVVAVQKFLTPHANFSIPEGGLGFWISPKTPDPDYFQKFYARKIIVSDGQLYSQKNSFRLNFANASEDEISAGIGIIASILGR